MDELYREKNVVMAKWLWVMFWLQIAMLGVGLIGGVAGAIGDVVCNLAIAWILLQMKSVDERYGKAAVFMAIAVVLQAVSDLMGENAALLSLVLLLPALVISLMAAYREYCAHSSVVGSADAALGQRWMTIWKWQIVSIAGILVSAVLVLIAPPFGALVMVVAGVIAIVTGVLRMVALYKSAQLFRKMTA